MSYNINLPISRAFDFEDTAFTYLITGVIDPINDMGKAVTFDTTQANTVKLAGVGDYVVGRIETYENRTQEKVQVAGVSRCIKNIVPIAAGLVAPNVPAVGGTVEGGGAGFVRGKSAADWNANIIVEIVTINGNSFAVVEKI